MTAIILCFVLFLFVIDSIDAGRRIRDGVRVTTQKRYVVYLIRAPISARHYDAWLCGGALVSHEFIITSAACLDDVAYAYAIAGYEKYVTDDQIEKDDCTKNMKKKLIYTCTPVSYELKADRLEKWSEIDIGLAKVESPYDFADPNFSKYCSYAPAAIPINYEKKYQHPGRDAMVLGWGHQKYWRKSNDTTNYNQKHLHYASCVIYANDFCIEDYKDYRNMSQVIAKYMICTNGVGNIAENGELIVTSKPNAQGCTSARDKLLGFEGIDCTDSSELDALNSRRNMSNDHIYNSSSLRNEGWYFRSEKHAGICQNDHGSPLVTWVGSQEVLIGVASVFKVSIKNKCIGPYLYTSTQRNRNFIDCVLTYNDQLPTSRADHVPRSRDFCNSEPSERGFETVENHISWKKHPAGLADNEKKSKKIVKNSKKSSHVSDKSRHHSDESRHTSEKFMDSPSKNKPKKQYSTEKHYKSMEIHQLELENKKHQIGGKYPTREKHQTDIEYTAKKKRQPDVIHITKQNIQESRQADTEYPTIVNYQTDIGYTAKKKRQPDVIQMSKQNFQESRQADTEYPTIVNYQTDIEYTAKKKRQPDVIHITKQNFQESHQADIEYPTIVNYQADIVHPANDSYQKQVVYQGRENIKEEKVYPINDSDQVDEIYLASGGYHSDKSNPPQERSQEGEIYPAYEVYLKNERHQVRETSSTDINHQSKEKLQAEKSYAAQDKLKGNKVYLAQKKHQAGEKNLAHTTLSGRKTTIFEKFTNKDRYAARQNDADDDSTLLISSK